MVPKGAHATSAQVDLAEHEEVQGHERTAA